MLGTVSQAAVPCEAQAYHQPSHMTAVISNYLVMETGNSPPQLQYHQIYEDLRPRLVQESISTIDSGLTPFVHARSCMTRKAN